jgi:hypothetical protein
MFKEKSQTGEVKSDRKNALVPASLITGEDRVRGIFRIGVGKEPRMARSGEHSEEKGEGPRRETEGEQYQRETLEVAREILEQATRDAAKWITALPPEKTHGATSYSDSQFREAILALNEKNLWNMLLRERGLHGEEEARAKAAVRDLAEHIQATKSGENTEVSLGLLHSAINILLAEIRAIDPRAAPSKRTERLKEAAERIGWQVAAAGADLTTDTGVSGAGLRYRLLVGGLSGSVVAAVVGILHDSLKQRFRGHGGTKGSQLEQVQKILVDRLGILVLYLAECKQGGNGKTAAAENARQQVGFLIMHARQLTAGDSRIGSRIYAAALSAAVAAIRLMRSVIRKRCRIRAVGAFQVQLEQVISDLKKCEAYVRNFK